MKKTNSCQPLLRLPFIEMALPVPVDQEQHPGLTDEPRHDEDQHLENIRRWMPARIPQYIDVTDDEGDLLGDRELEKEAWWASQVHRYINQEPIDNQEDAEEIWNEMKEDPEDSLDDLLKIFTHYNDKVLETEFKVSGILTRYYIRLGMIANLMKVLVKQSKHNWGEWKKRNLPSNRCRSINDYMRIANIPNAIRYAVFTIDRLLEIDRAIKKHKGTDPIKDFLNENNIQVDPLNPDSVDHFKDDIDTAILKRKLANAVDENNLEAVPDNDCIKRSVQLRQNLTKNDIQHYIDHLKDGMAANEAFNKVIEAKKNGVSSEKEQPVADAYLHAEELKDLIDYIYNSPELSQDLETHRLLEVLEYIYDKVKNLNR